jgi:hypothetical protein
MQNGKSAFPVHQEVGGKEDAGNRFLEFMDSFALGRCVRSPGKGIVPSQK